MPPVRPLVLFLVKLTVVVLSLLAPERAIGAPAPDGHQRALASTQGDGSEAATNVLVRRRRSRSGTTLHSASAAVGLALRFDVPTGSWTGGRDLIVAADPVTLALMPARDARVASPLAPPLASLAVTTPPPAADAGHPSPLGRGPLAPRPPPTA